MAKELRIKGLDKVIKRLKMAEANVSRSLASALFVEGSDIITTSKQLYVPVETGALRTSGEADIPKINGPNIKVTLGFGGAAAPYAAAVHEAPQSYNWSVSGTGPKYLEKPAREATPGMSKRIAARLKGTL